MRRLGLMMAGVLAFAQMSSVANAEPSANHDYLQLVHEFCTDVIASGELPGLSFGECVSFNVVSEQGFTPHFCDALREGAGGTLEDYGFDSYADCVRNLEL